MNVPMPPVVRRIARRVVPRVTTRNFPYCEFCAHDVVFVGGRWYLTDSTTRCPHR